MTATGVGVAPWHLRTIDGSVCASERGKSDSTKGAVPLLDAPSTLLLPLATIEAAVKKARKY